METTRMNESTGSTNATPAGMREHVIVERTASAGLITLNRPKALNALTLDMVRTLTKTLSAWRDDPSVHLVAIRGSNKAGRPDTADSLFGHFCAGGDIRFFHDAALAGHPELDDFYTEEYVLNFLIQNFPKPYVAFLDGVVMGGGMGLCQGAPATATQPGGKIRIVTERTKMAMPETNIGLFPDVGGGYFLNQCPGHVGTYLGLTGHAADGAQAIAFGLADVLLASSEMPALWADLALQRWTSVHDAERWLAKRLASVHQTPETESSETQALMVNVETYFSLPRVKHMVDALEQAGEPWAKKTAKELRRRSPLMLHVTLEQLKRSRGRALADVLRMERGMVHQCFYLRPGAQSETVEGIRALVVDKDYAPKWNPAHIDQVKPPMINAFFDSPWEASEHPLRDL
jgi:enoyl-CoA hydratase/carnithine racemase